MSPPAKGVRMLAESLSASIVGVDGLPVRVEVDVAFGLPGLTIVGLAGSEVLEARERVRAALRNSGFEVPARRITVNLAPGRPAERGHRPRPGRWPRASSSRPASSRRTSARVDALIGELALDGSLRPVPGAMALVAAAPWHGHRRGNRPDRERARERRGWRRRRAAGGLLQPGRPPPRRAGRARPSRARGNFRQAHRHERTRRTSPP